MFWRVVLWVLAVLFGLLILFLVVPAGVQVRYHLGRLQVKVRVLFIPVTLYPMHKRPKWLEGKPEKKRKKKPEGEEGQKAQEKQDKHKTLQQRLWAVQRTVESAGVGLSFLLRHTQFRDVEFAAVVNTGDAAQTAIWYGRLQAMLSGCVAALQNTLNIRFKRAYIEPDFAGQYEHMLYFSCKIQAMPVILIAALILGFKRYVTYYKQFPQLQAELERRRQQRSNSHGKQ